MLPLATVWVALTTLTLGSLEAQQSAAHWPAAEVFAGSNQEEYLRALQVAGEIPPYPWTIRGFSPSEIERLLPRGGGHPWSPRFESQDSAKPALRAGVIPPTWTVIYNSAFPFGGNDAAVWAGRGLTAAVQAGFWSRLGPLSVRVAPLVFRAQNAEVPLRIDQNVDEYSIFADPKYPMYIDLPQRFGAAPYARLDPGQSEVRLDLAGISLAASTSNHYWGPARQNPMVLGNNAAGFPHVYLGSSQPVSTWIGKLHGRLIWGSLDQSPYSFMPDSLSRRFMTGLVAVYQPRGLRGLEIGGARFFHNLWPRDGLRLTDFEQPFESLLKIRLPLRGEPSDTFGDEYNRSAGDNQIASVFARWTFPGSGFELYGEFAREDHNYDFRDLVLEITHNSGYMVGLRKVWARDPEALYSLGVEILQAEPGHTTLARDITQFPFYLHGTARQGHTQYGQALGSAAGYGGAEALLTFDLFDRTGRWHVDWRRTVRDSSDELLQDDPVYYHDRGIDAIHSLRLERLTFVGRWDITAGLTAAYDFNRDYDDDVANLNAVVQVRTAW